MYKGDILKMDSKYSNKDECLLDGYRLFHLLRQTADSIYKAREAELKKYKLTPEQAGALVCIQSLGNKATPAELSRWLFRKRNSITVLLNRMQKLGLINKQVNQDRKNSITISLTKKGYDAFKNSIEFQTFHRINDILPKKKRKQLWLLLQTIRLRIFKDLMLDVDAYSGFFDKPLAIYPNDSDANFEKLEPR
jgi:DNA-binding MarR family transcriptional regulator